MTKGAEMLMHRKNTWIYGIIASAIGAAIPFVHQNDNDLTFVIILFTVGIILTTIIEMRIKIGEIEEASLNTITELDKTEKIYRYGTKDKAFLARLTQCKQEITDLSNGTYRLPTLKDVYIDDIRTINNLRKGEWLRSTCPMPRGSDEERSKYIKEEDYLGSIESHIEAAKRGVNVVRIYFFPTSENVQQEDIYQHLIHIRKQNIGVIIKLYDKIAPIGHDPDFLVFGETKVSVGVMDHASGKVLSGIVHYDGEIISRYTKLYDDMIQTARVLELPKDVT